MVGEVVSVQTALATGDVDIIAGGGEWATAVLMAEDPNMEWVNPDQGGVRWSQSIGVFSDAGNPELARKFVEYVLSPEGRRGWRPRRATGPCPRTARPLSPTRKRRYCAGMNRKPSLPIPGPISFRIPSWMPCSSISGRKCCNTDSERPKHEPQTSRPARLRAGTGMTG